MTDDMHRQLGAKIEELDQALRVRRDSVLRLAGCTTVNSLHGIIGGKNGEFVDIIRQKFLSPQQFIDEWEMGALRKAREQEPKKARYAAQGVKAPAIFRLIQLLKCDEIRKYTHLFLERNFYKQYYERIREKPSENLWEIWFGSNPLVWGLLISPRFVKGKWENDVSEIRRTGFRYWTIGHVLETGYCVPGNANRLLVSSVEEFFTNYQHVLMRDTKSCYGKAIATFYENFARSQPDPKLVPLLIPEFRYEGIEIDHKHRLDFTILCAEEGLRVGVELSPWSSHGRVRSKNQIRESGGEAAVEQERIKKWNNEMQKRNEYFEQFGIATLTYTDSDLTDLESVFLSIARYLQPARSLDFVDTAREIQRYRL